MRRGVRVGSAPAVVVTQDGAASQDSDTGGERAYGDYWSAIVHNIALSDGSRSDAPLSVPFLDASVNMKPVAVDSLVPGVVGRKGPCCGPLVQPEDISVDISAVMALELSDVSSLVRKDGQNLTRREVCVQGDKEALRQQVLRFAFAARIAEMAGEHGASLDNVVEQSSFLSVQTSVPVIYMDGDDVSSRADGGIRVVCREEKAQAYVDVAAVELVLPLPVCDGLRDNGWVGELGSFSIPSIC